ncbi:pectinesterase inhibitor 9-like [Chenopodium quinoa]|uniref:Pectinesterase inhibitor domain-containing protein n=1 Tax=Chenopodium quinoa TaxID=63459 RepID=A0A803N3P1_CHEQI|nr:pectinesterase inhibitor 9-like [Chenopodium quinoa]
MRSSVPQKLTSPLIFLFLIFLSFNPSSASTKPSTSTSSTNFIKKCCSTTTYPTLCYSTLLPHASQIQNNPKRLATKALVIALIEAKSAAQTTARLSKTGALKPMEKAALSDCTMAVGTSAAQLARSIEKMGGAPAWTETEMEASDVETWTSTALTYAGTCRDAFDGSGTNGNVKLIVQRKVVKLSQLTSNALALIKRYYVAAAKIGHHHENHP